MNETIKAYIKKNYDFNTPVFSYEIMRKFNLVKGATIRQILRRFVKDGWLASAGPGIFFIPEKNATLGFVGLTPERIVDQKYITSKDGIIGFKTGFAVANMLKLTVQTSPVLEVVSNVAPERKRETTINKRRVTIKKSKIAVNDSNWKLLQVLDILKHFDTYSEHSIFDVGPSINQYLSDLSLSAEDIRDIVLQYPIATQLNFYKLGLATNH